MTLTYRTIEHLLALLDDELIDGGRSRRAKQDRHELLAMRAEKNRVAAKPLLFTCEWHRDVPLQVWTYGDLEAPVTLETKPGAEILLGLHVIQLALESKGQRVDLQPLDPRPLDDKAAMTSKGWAQAVSRARAEVRKYAPVLCAALRVTVHNDGTASFNPKPDDPEIKLSK